MIGSVRSVSVPFVFIVVVCGPSRVQRRVGRVVCVRFPSYGVTAPTWAGVVRRVVCRRWRRRAFVGVRACGIVRGVCVPLYFIHKSGNLFNIAVAGMVIVVTVLFRKYVTNLSVGAVSTSINTSMVICSASRVSVLSDNLLWFVMYAGRIALLLLLLLLLLLVGDMASGVGVLDLLLLWSGAAVVLMWAIGSNLACARVVGRVVSAELGMAVIAMGVAGVLGRSGGRWRATAGVGWEPPPFTFLSGVGGPALVAAVVPIRFEP